MPCESFVVLRYFFFPALRHKVPIRDLSPELPVGRMVGLGWGDDSQRVAWWAGGLVGVSSDDEMFCGVGRRPAAGRVVSARLGSSYSREHDEDLFGAV